MKINLKTTIFSAVSLFFIACGTPANNNANSGVNQPAVMPPSVSTESRDVVFAQWQNPPSLDPHASNDTISSEVQYQIFEALTAFDENGDLVPSLAENFSLVEPTVWEFNLRSGVYFHDGTYFNSYAVYRSLNRILENTASPRRFILEMIEDVIIVDEYTVRITTLFPFSPLPSHLSHPAGFIISPNSLDSDISVDELPIGTGPFSFSSRIHGQEIVMVRNDSYWGDLPQIETLTFRVIPESSQRVNMLITGEANAIIASAIDAQEIRENPNLTLIEVPSTRQNYIGFNTQTPPFDDVRVRRAIAMVVDLDAIVHGIAGMGIPAVGPLPPTVAGAPQGIVPLTGTVEEARNLLAEAGFPDGFTTNIAVGAGRPLEESLTAQILQANLAEIGITANINEMEWGAFLDYTAVGNHEIFILGWTVVTADADYGVFPLFHSTLHGVSGNRTFFTNSTVDRLLEEARMEVDMARRTELYSEIVQIIVDEAPKVSTFYPTFAIGTNGINNLFVNINATPIFSRVTFD
ncbi:MAG: ABC transporter substrate-binding protein [Defluviitaleaceae bacterium]|nr:ABC transporter substrate-binding protein [Defluviitaleaceae bacterium]